MKKRLGTSVFSAAVIVLFVVVAVNPKSPTQNRSGAVLVADGVPLPPPGPRPFTGGVIDGVPLPPPGPRPFAPETPFLPV